MGVQKRRRFSVNFSSPNAIAVWQWFQFLLGQVPPGRPVLRLNLDETSVRFWYEPRLGLRRLTDQAPRAGYARQATRGQLQQFILSRRHYLRRRLLAETFLCLVIVVWCLAVGARCLVLGDWRLVLGAWCLALGAWCWALGV